MSSRLPPLLLLTGLSCASSFSVSAGEASVAGTVRNAITGTPIRKAVITLSRSDERLTAESDAEGRFLFQSLPPGRWKLSGGRPGFLDRGARKRITLAADQHVTDAELRLPPQGVISGRILDEDGDPVSRVRVSLFTQIYQDGRRHWERRNMAAVSSDTGEYKFSELVPGRYLVRADDPRPGPWNPYTDRGKAVMVAVSVWYPNARTEQTATPLDIVAGADLRGIDLRVLRVARPPSVHVRGRVDGMAASAVSEGISVALIPVDPNAPAAAASASAVAKPPEYTFDMEVPPGEYKIVANMYSSSDPPAWGRGIVAVAGNVSGVVVRVNPPPEVTGRIRVVQTDMPAGDLSKVRMALRPLMPFTDLPEFRSDSAGKLKLSQPLPPGRYSLVVDLNTIPEGLFVKGIRLGDQELAPSDEFEIAASSVLEVYLAGNAGTIAGTVVDATGEQGSDASVALIPLDAKVRPRIHRVSEDGAFRFSAVAPGSYLVYAWDRIEDIQWQDPEIYGKYESSASKVTIAPGENRTVRPRLTFTDEPN